MVLHRNESTLKLIVSDTGKLCTSCCRFADSDCECFNGLLWDSETEYVAGATVRHEDVYYNALIDNDDVEPPGPSPPNPVVWLDISPYGGTDGTPQEYTIAVQGIQLDFPLDVRDPNGTHILTYDPFVPVRLCTYTLTIPAGDGYEEQFFRLTLDISTVEIFILVPNARGLFTGNPAGGDCLVFREFENVLFEPGHGGGWGGTVKQLPGRCAAWEDDIFYEIGACVGHVGEFYKCKVAHINQEPPNITYWKITPDI